MSAGNPDQRVYVYAVFLFPDEPGFAPLVAPLGPQLKEGTCLDGGLNEEEGTNKVRPA